MKEKAVPLRRCVGCMESKPKKELIRIAGYEGVIKLDPTGKAKGRGVYVCPKEECFQKAIKKRAITRGLEIEFAEGGKEALLKELEEYEFKN